MVEAGGARDVRSSALQALVLLVFCLGVPVVTSAQSAPAPPVLGVTEITLERDCFGCSTGSILVLRRDGTATDTVTGKARAGTQNHVSRGKIRSVDFEKLARLMVSEGFFAFKDEYENPELRDGAWTTIGAVRDGQEKKIFRREHEGPGGLDGIEKAIDAVRTQITFIPDRR